MIILALGTLITYSYHSVYFDLDKPVLPQGHHALRYKVWTGMAWVRWTEEGGRGERTAGCFRVPSRSAVGSACIQGEEGACARCCIGLV